MAEIKSLFTPEFRNRLDAVISFARARRRGHPARGGQVPDAARGAARREEGRGAVHRRRSRSTWRRTGFDPLMGARPMARLIQDTIRRALADELLFGQLAHGGKVTIDVDDGREGRAALRGSSRRRRSPDRAAARTGSPEAAVALFACGSCRIRRRIPEIARSGADRGLPAAGRRTHDRAAQPAPPSCAICHGTRRARRRQGRSADSARRPAEGPHSRGRCATSATASGPRPSCTRSRRATATRRSTRSRPGSPRRSGRDADDEAQGLPQASARRGGRCAGCAGAAPAEGARRRGRRRLRRRDGGQVHPAVGSGDRGGAGRAQQPRSSPVRISNLVLGGFRTMDDITAGYDGLRAPRRAGRARRGDRDRRRRRARAPRARRATSPTTG